MMTSVNSSITSSESQTGHTLEFDLAKDGNLPTRVGKLFRNIISSSSDSSHTITISLDNYEEDCKRAGISKRTYFKRVFENLVEQAAGETQTLAQEKANAINTTAWGIFCDIISFNWIGGFFGKGREQDLAETAKNILNQNMSISVSSGLAKDLTKTSLNYWCESLQSLPKAQSFMQQQRAEYIQGIKQSDEVFLQNLLEGLKTTLQEELGALNVGALYVEEDNTNDLVYHNVYNLRCYQIFMDSLRECYENINVLEEKKERFKHLFSSLEELTTNGLTFRGNNPLLAYEEVAKRQKDCLLLDVPSLTEKVSSWDSDPVSFMYSLKAYLKKS